MPKIPAYPESVALQSSKPRSCPGHGACDTNINVYKINCHTTTPDQPASRPSRSMIRNLNCFEPGLFAAIELSPPAAWINKNIKQKKKQQKKQLKKRQTNVSSEVVYIHTSPRPRWASELHFERQILYLYILQYTPIDSSCLQVMKFKQRYFLKRSGHW